MENKKHISVLLQETIEGLQLHSGAVIIDMTLGRGGHSKAVLESGYTDMTVIGIDADPSAILESKNLLEPIAEQTGNKIIFAETYNDNVLDVLKENNIEVVHSVMFDLGISSPQVDSSGRGFSFQHSEPLDMTMSNKSGLTAREVINTWEESSLSDIIYGYGEEKYARRIAKKIVEARDEDEITTTDQLVEIIKKSVPGKYRYGKIHPATRTFQALRITVNDELERLKRALVALTPKVLPKGRIVVISFHSLEDRIVKRFFRGLENESLGQRITKKPLIPTIAEIEENPRSRSAKLRIFEKN